MAGKIKGITVEIGGNVTGLNKALDSTNKQINSTQNELKKVEKLLKLDPTNTELLKQKQGLLAKAVGDTRDKLSTLKEAEKQAQQQFREGKISQEQYNALEREIVSTKESLKGLESQAKQSNITLQKIGTTAGKVAEKTKVLSAAAGGALVGLGAAALKAGQNADDLNTLAKQTGLTTAELQKMQYASDIVDVSVENITGALKKMKRNMDSSSGDVQAAWERIKVSTVNADGSMRDATTVFYESLEGLSKISNETERDQLAMDLFGKSADELAGIVDDGGAALKQMGEEAEKAGLILSQDAVDSANEFNDSVDRLKATASASFSKVGTQLATLLIPALERLCSAASQALGWFTNLSPAGQGVILTVLALVAAISPMAKLIQGISVVTGALTAIKTAHASATAVETAATTAATAAQTGLNLAFLACPLTWIVLAIMALVAVFIHLWNNCDGFRNFWINLWEIIKKAVSSAIDWIKGFFNNVIDFVKNNWQGLLLFLVNPFAGAFKLIWDNCEGFRNFWINLWQGIVNTVSSAWSWINGIFSSVINFVQNNWQGLLLFIANPFAGAFKLIWDNCEGFRNFWINLWNSIKNLTLTAGNWLKDFFKSLPSQALEWGKDMIQGLINGIKNMIGKVGDAVKGVGEKIRSFLHFSVPDEGPLTDYESWMPDFMQGLADGIDKSKSLVTNAVKGLSTDMSMNMNLTPAMAGVGSGNGIINHTGTIRIEGVSNDGQYYNAVDMVIDQLKREGRL